MAKVSVGGVVGKGEGPVALPAEDRSPKVVDGHTAHERQRVEARPALDDVAAHARVDHVDEAQRLSLEDRRAAESPGNAERLELVTRRLQPSVLTAGVCGLTDHQKGEKAPVVHTRPPPN